MGQRKGLPKAKKRQPLCPDLLNRACDKADELKDIRFFFGRCQGLRKEDYCGLRWCDIDLENELIHLCRYSWEGKKRNLKLKEGGERSIPIHSQLLWRIKAYLPEAFSRNDQQPIWEEDYKAMLECWGALFLGERNHRPVDRAMVVPLLLLCKSTRSSSVVTLLRQDVTHHLTPCLLYTSPSPRDRQKSRMPSSA